MGQIYQTEKNDEEIDVKELQDMYKKFVVECPSGVLFLHEFKRFFGVDPTGEDNTIDFLEFVAALNLAFRGDLEHKLRWLFKVFDKNSNGYVDRINKSTKKDLHVSQLSVDEVVERILEAVDTDRDGAQQDPWVLNIGPPSSQLEVMGQEESHNEEIDLAQIQELCIIFMKECPSGALHLHEFKRIFGVQSSSEEESTYIETIFHSFDTNQDNALDFMEYIAALHLVLRGNLEDRLKWSFKIYDKDRNGKLDRQEVKQIIR
ncbi:hypothetical protein CRUP_018192, partial [Coryphaenoides rupestris]